LCTLGAAIGTNPFDIEFWYFPLNGSFGGICGLGRAYSSANPSVGALSVFFSYAGAGNKIYFQDRVASINVPSITTLSTNAWHHVAITRKSSNLVQIYIDGVQTNSKTSVSNFLNASFSFFSPYTDVQQTPAI